MPLFRSTKSSPLAQRMQGIPSKQILQGESTGPQHAGWAERNPGGIGLAALSAELFGGIPGYNAANPCGFPGWGLLYMGLPTTYRMILDHPIIRLAHRVMDAPVRSNTWTVTKGDEGDDNAVKLVEKAFLPQRRAIVANCLRAIDFGYSPSEIVWEQREGKYWPRLKALLPDWTNIVTDASGNFAGLTQSNLGLLPGVEIVAGVTPLGIPVPGLGKYKSFLHTHDGDDPFYGLYGRSRLENVRVYAWKQWLDTCQDLARLRGKLSGVLGMGFAPEVFDGAGNSLWDRMKTAVRALTQHGFALIPTWSVKGAPPQNVKDMAEMFKFQFYDAGNHSPAIAGYIQLMEHWESLMFAGMLRSARTGLEGKHGTKAEADSHKDTGICDAESIDDEITESVNKLVDDFLALNLGDNARGAARLTPIPIQDEKADARREWLQLFSTNPSVAVAAAKMVDWSKSLEADEIPTLENVPFDLDAAIAESKPTPAVPPRPNLAEEPPVNGKPPVKLGAAARRLLKRAG